MDGIGIKEMVDRISKLKPVGQGEAKAADERLRQEKVRQILLAGNPPELNLRMKGEDLDRSGSWGKLEAMVKRSIGTGITFCLMGTRGCGKSQVAVEAMRLVAGNLRTVKYTTVTRLFVEMKDGYGRSDRPSEKDVLDAHVRPALLVLDELGNRRENEWENLLLCELLNSRYGACRDTILISNQDAGSVEAALGPSLMSRMRETGGIIPCNWASYRK